MISAVIITKNEESHLESCLKQLDFTEEQIVVDNNSTDNTVQIAQKNGATVVSIKDTDFSLLRNTGAQNASHDWLLYVDTDEKISQQLREEILSTVKNFSLQDVPHAYRIKRTNYYLGVKWPVEDGMIRLIYKPSLKKWYGQLHETADIKGDIGELHERIQHHTHRSLEQMVSKTNEWSSIEANLRLNAKHPPVVAWRIMRVMVTGFFNSYVRQQGWKAGTVGLIESMYQGFSMFITYSKLWEMQQKEGM